MRLQGRWLLVAVLMCHKSSAMLCKRAGGVKRNQEFLDDAVRVWETADMCALRGCKFDSRGECHYPELEAENITTVHLIQSNHLDVGYTDTAVDVINTYFDTFFPRAIQVGAKLRQSGGKERLAWMTQTYLVSLFLSCPPGIGLHCPSANAIDEFKAAVTAGDITWQAFPHNAELMMLDRSLLTFGVNVTHDIDDLLKQPRKTVVSSRDVPGFDRSIIPVLKNVGIKGLSMGMNGRIFPVNVPPAFLWRDEGHINDTVTFTSSARAQTPTTIRPASKEDILVLWHPRGYGGLGDYVTVPGLSHALAYAWRGDNQGPPESTEEVENDFKTVRKAFPGANVIASTLDAFIEELDTVRNKLPVVTKEVGDSWIWGCAQDPVKHQQLRAMMRARSQYLNNQDQAEAHDPSDAVYNFSREILKGSEHTWGIHVQSYGPHLNGPYTNSEFHAQRGQPSEGTIGVAARFNGAAKYVMDFESAWLGQRVLTVENALDALPPSHPLLKSIDEEFAEFGNAPLSSNNSVTGSSTRRLHEHEQEEEWLLPASSSPVAHRNPPVPDVRPTHPLVPDPSAEGFIRVPDAVVESGTINGSSALLHALGGWCSLKIDPNTGALIGLTNMQAGQAEEWASPDKPLALLRYQSLVDDDMTAWRKEYLIQDCPSEYGKPGCMSAKPTPSRHLDPPIPVELWVKRKSKMIGAGGSGMGLGADEVLLRSMFGADLHSNYGAPSEVWTRFVIPQLEATLLRGNNNSNVTSRLVTRGVDVSVTLVNKTATRLPEAIFLTFNPLHHTAPTPVPPAPTPPPAPNTTHTKIRGVASVPAGASGHGQISINVVFPQPFTAVPVVVVSTNQGSGGGGKNNDATFIAVVREVTKSGFVASVQISSLAEKAVWVEESQLLYIAALPTTSANPPELFASADIGMSLKNTKTITVKREDVAGSTCENAVVLLSPRTTRGASNSDIYSVVLSSQPASSSDGSCSFDVTAGRVADPKSADTHWGQDLKLDYLLAKPEKERAQQDALAQRAGHATIPACKPPLTQLSSRTFVPCPPVAVVFPSPFPSSAASLPPSVITTVVPLGDGSGGVDHFTASLSSLSQEGFSVVVQRLNCTGGATGRGWDNPMNLSWVADDTPAATPPPTPAPPSPGPSDVYWAMDKLGEFVSPLDLVDGGSKGLHGVSSGVLFSRQAMGDSRNSSHQRVFFETLDAGLVAWGKPDPFPIPIHSDPDLEEGASFLLYDNIWNTNYGSGMFFVAIIVFLTLIASLIGSFLVAV